MKQLNTTGIILSRTDYGEADRILTLLTPNYGKLRLMARGVRRVKSKLAGGIELFSISDITFIRGRGELGTLVSTRLIKHYGHIVQDLNRTMLAYDLIKQLNRITEDEAEAAYFDLLQGVFAALDDPRVTPELTKSWFLAQLLAMGGHRPNLETDSNGQKLQADKTYDFSLEHMYFVPAGRETGGRFTASHIKFLRLLFGPHQAKVLAHIQGADGLLQDTVPLVQGTANISLHP